MNDEQMFKTMNCLLQVNEDGTEETVIHVSHSNEATESKGYPFGSRVFGDTQRKIDDVLNGKYYRLPFGIRIVKT